MIKFEVAWCMQLVGKEIEQLHTGIFFVLFFLIVSYERSWGKSLALSPLKVTAPDGPCWSTVFSLTFYKIG